MSCDLKICGALWGKIKKIQYDFPKIENSGGQASELPEKPLHVMVILFSRYFKKSGKLGKDTILGTPKMIKIWLKISDLDLTNMFKALPSAPPAPWAVSSIDFLGTQHTYFISFLKCF